MRLSNATYGVLGAPTSAFYNIYVASAITRGGRSYISCSMMLFESFLGNNVKFNSLNEIIQFIHNVVSESGSRKYDDSLILDRDITREECFYKLMDNVDPLIWVPTEKQMDLVWARIQALSNEDVNRIFYKNNLYCFCELNPIKDLITKILCALDKPFMNPNEPPEIIKADLDALTELLKEYVYYRHIYIDKLDRIEYMQRDIVCITDTDSCIISFDAWYRFVLGFTYNIDMPIKHEKFRMYQLVKADEFGDRPKRLMTEPVEPRFDYNFYTDEVIEIHKLEAPAKVIPQESLRYSIINIIAYICSKLVVDYLTAYCSMANSYQSKGQCIMIMKNEFLFNTVLLTDNRRNYSSQIAVQEGNIVPQTKKASLTIAGLNIIAHSL